MWVLLIIYDYAFMIMTVLLNYIKSQANWKM